MKKRNMPIVVNFSKEGKGYFLLLEDTDKEKLIEDEEGTKRQEICYPIDIHQSDLSEVGFIDRILQRSPDLKVLNDPIEILLYPNCRVPHPIGSPSRRRNIVEYYSPMVSEINPENKNTRWLRYITFYRSREQFLIDTIYAQFQHAQNIKNLILKHGGGEMTDAIMKEVYDQLKLATSIKELEGKEKIKTM